MIKFISLTTYMFVFFFVIGVSDAKAQSAKATAKVGNINVVDSEKMPWTSILSNTLKTPNKKHLFIDVSLECGVFNKTQVKSKGGKRDTSESSAQVAVKVLIDGKLAKPGVVTFCRRDQKLSASLGGILDQCSDKNGDGIISLDECELIDEEIELVLRSMNANSFNFIADGLSAGDHKIEVLAQIESATSSEAGDAQAAASIGNGSMTVEEVRLVKDDNIELD